MTRRFTIQRQIGSGGQGEVYHARLEEGGVARDVALKLLKGEPSEEVLARLREEARILEVVDDRAVPRIEPPVRVGDRWAVVMELVDGISAKWAVVRGGALPPTVALEIVREVARVLRRIYEAEDPSGRPLRLVHCDIKPGNVQITKEGAVALLDFGVARVDSRHRQVPVDTVGATPGFVAPERLRGIDTPAGDVHSLGVTLRVLATGEWPGQPGDPPGGYPDDVREVVALAELMGGPDPDWRPEVDEVERLAGELRDKLTGPSLPEWAREQVPQMASSVEDPLVGAVLVEGAEPDPLPPAPSGRGWLRWVGLAAAGLAVMALGVVGSLATFAALGFGPEPIPGAPAPGAGEDLALVEEEPPEVPAAPDPDPPDPATSSPAIAAADVGGAPEAPPTAASTAPAPRAPKPAPLPEAEQVEVTVTADRPSTVWIDGVEVGRTPLRLSVTPGKHRLRLAEGGDSVEASVLVGGRRGATRFEWAGGDQIGVR